MQTVTLEWLTQQLALGEQLLALRGTMFEPQDLPGRFGRVIKDIDRVLQPIDSAAVLAGGWAVWRHGYFARMTQDVDIVLPADKVDDFLRTASVAGFELLHAVEGRWPKVQHKATDITVDILPQGGRPGTADNLAPTLIAHPSDMGGTDARLHYITLPALVQLKLAAGRARDESDVIELLRVNPDKAAIIRDHLATIHVDYVSHFDMLAARAAKQSDH
jgi:hypothetical protein